MRVQRHRSYELAAGSIRNRCFWPPQTRCLEPSRCAELERTRFRLTPRLGQATFSFGFHDGSSIYFQATNLDLRAENPTCQPPFWKRRKKRDQDSPRVYSLNICKRPNGYRKKSVTSIYVAVQALVLILVPAPTFDALSHRKADGARDARLLR